MKKFITLLFFGIVCYSFDLYSQQEIINYYTDNSNKIHIQSLLLDSTNYAKRIQNFPIDTVYVKFGIEYKDISFRFYFYDSSNNNSTKELFPIMVKNNIPIFMGFNCVFDSNETFQRKLESNTHYSTGYLPYITNYYKNTNSNFQPYDSLSRETILINPESVIKYSEKQIQNNTIVNLYILVNSGSNDSYFLRTRFIFKIKE